MKINSYFELECICRSLAMAYKTEKGFEHWENPFDGKNTTFKYLKKTFPDCNNQLLAEIWKYLSAAYNEELSGCYSKTS